MPTNHKHPAIYLRHLPEVGWAVPTTHIAVTPLQFPVKTGPPSLGRGLG